jgi:hypothetical protein
VGGLIAQPASVTSEPSPVEVPASAFSGEVIRGVGVGYGHTTLITGKKVLE